MGAGGKEPMYLCNTSEGHPCEKGNLDGGCSVSCKGIEDDVTAKQESPVTKSPEGAVTDIGLDAETLAKLASSPEFASLLKIFAKNI